MQANSWGLGRDGSHWAWDQDYKANDQKSFIGIFELLWLCRHALSWRRPQHSPSLVLNGTVQFIKCFTIDLRCDSCSSLHEIAQNHTLLVPEHSRHDFLWDWVFLNFFSWGEVEWRYYMERCFNSESLYEIHVCRQWQHGKILIPLSVKAVQNSCADLCSLWALVSIFSTHPAHRLR